MSIINDWRREGAIASLKILHQPCSDDGVVDVIALHGIGARADATWVKLDSDASRFEWLSSSNLLPSIIPDTSILRYGYDSTLREHEGIGEKLSSAAEDLLITLRNFKVRDPLRPQVFVAHCFGGLVLLKALVEAKKNPKKWPGIFLSTSGIVFLGTPFRGTGELTQAEILRCIQNKYEPSTSDCAPSVLDAEDKILTELVEEFIGARKIGKQTQVMCFFEEMPCRIEREVNGKWIQNLAVDERSGSLDDTTSIPLLRNHFGMTKYSAEDEADYITVSSAIRDMVLETPEVMQTRSEDLEHFWDPLSRKGVPEVKRFIPRDPELNTLSAALINRPHNRNVFVLSGMGGIGKTQLCAEFARRHMQDFSAVFWIDASTNSQLKLSLVEVLDTTPKNQDPVDDIPLGISLEEEEQPVNSDCQDVDLAVEKVLEWLARPFNTHWLLIFDNADRDLVTNPNDPKAYDITSFFPRAAHGSILISTRATNLGRVGPNLRLEAMNETQSLDLIRSRLLSDVQGTATLYELLGGVPLALELASSYMRETRTSPEDYSIFFKQEWALLMEEEYRHPRTGSFQEINKFYHQSIRTAWTLSFERIRLLDNSVDNLLWLWAHLDNKELSLDLFPRTEELSHRDVVEGYAKRWVENFRYFTGCMELLVQFSLVNARVGSRPTSYSMHPLLHRWCYFSANTKCQENIKHFKALANKMTRAEKLDNASLETFKRRFAHHEYTQNVSLGGW